jgi:hypothetical protein
MIGMPCNWVQFAGSRGKSHIRKPVEARSPNPQGVEEQLAASVRSHDALVLLDLLLVATLFAVRILQLKHHPLPFGADKNGIRHDTLRQLSTNPMGLESLDPKTSVCFCSTARSPPGSS